MSEYLTESITLDRVESRDGSEGARNNTEKNEKWLTFWLGNQLFGFSIMNVEQIVRMMPITEVPYYPTYAKGIIDLRGTVIPIIDLRVLLNMVDVQETSRTCIIIASLNGSQVGFVVDGIDAVFDIPDDEICQPPIVNKDGSNTYLTGIATVANDDVNDQHVLLIDMERILKGNEFEHFVFHDA